MQYSQLVSKNRIINRENIRKLCFAEKFNILLKMLFDQIFDILAKIDEHNENTSVYF